MADGESLRSRRPSPHPSSMRGCLHRPRMSGGSGSAGGHRSREEARDERRLWLVEEEEPPGDPRGIGEGRERERVRTAAAQEKGGGQMGVWGMEELGFVFERDFISMESD